MSRRICPVCDQPLDRETPGERICLPSTCSAWTVTARFDHETRQWVHPKMFKRMQATREGQE